MTAVPVARFTRPLAWAATALALGVVVFAVWVAASELAEPQLGGLAYVVATAYALWAVLGGGMAWVGVVTGRRRPALGTGIAVIGLAVVGVVAVPLMTLPLMTLPLAT